MHISKPFANQERLCAMDTGQATNLLQLRTIIANEALAFRISKKKQQRLKQNEIRILTKEIW